MSEVDGDPAGVSWPPRPSPKDTISWYPYPCKAGPRDWGLVARDLTRLGLAGPAIFLILDGFGQYVLVRDVTGFDLSRFCVYWSSTAAICA